MFLFHIGASAGAAGAQDWQQLTGPGRQGVESCPLPRDGRDAFFCLSLTCPHPGRAMDWTVTYRGTALGDGELPVAISVDHGAPQVIRLGYRPGPEGVQSYVGGFDRKAHGLLLTRLAQGLNAELVLGEGAGAVTHRLGLAGSHRAITALDDLCPDPIAHAPAEAPMAAPYAAPTGPDPRTGQAESPKPGILPYPGGYPPGHVLSAADVRATLIGHELSWSNSGGASRMLFRADGQLTGLSQNGESARPFTGHWQLREDGQLCWTTHASGCFRFRGAADGLHVLRSDGGRALDLGRVSIAP
ncbi:MAG: hypothetical protein GYB53_12355 [Rhodobacteraceae bacterium]|nr:hypothetical protein [Paracoccaceae bacterium]MBR9821466.1 hypothetical protein [Paracoccaceae bacterium]